MEAVTIRLHEHEMEIEGVRVSYEVLPHLIRCIVQPDPRRWLRFERQGDIVHVNVRLSEGETHGTDTAIIGRTNSRTEYGKEHPGGEGQAVAHPRSSPSANEE
jgi:hypothetical protein